MNKHLRPNPKAKVWPESLTQPDQALSIKELIQRYANGLPLPADRSPIFEDPEAPSQGVNINTLDLSEKHELLEKGVEAAEKMKAAQKKRAQKREEEELQRRINAEAEKLAKTREKTPQNGE